MLLGKSVEHELSSEYRTLVVNGMKILGVVMCKDSVDTIRENYPPILERMKISLNLWVNRSMSIYGKIAILKTLVVPKLIYALTMLPSPPKSFWDEANGLFYKFLNDNKRDKHKRRTLIGPYNRGGLNMVDIETQNSALKIGWMRRLMDTAGMWRDNVIERYKQIDYRYLLQSNIRFADLPVKHSKNNVWREIWIHWCLYNHETEVNTIEGIMNQNIWYNSHIKANKSILFYPTWYNAGLGWLHQLLDENTKQFLTKEELSARFNIKVNFLEYYSLLHSIPKTWKKKIEESRYQENLDDEGDMKVIDRLEEAEKPSKYIYGKLIRRIHEPPMRQRDQWGEDCGEIWSEQLWLGNFVHNITSYNKLRSYRYNLLVRNIPYNTKLCNMGILGDPTCYHCEEIGTLLHVYWECHVTEQLWLNIANWSENIFGHRITLCKSNCLLNMENENNPKFDKTVKAKLIKLATCHYIHVNFCNKTLPEIDGLIRSIKSIHSTEKSIYQKKGKLPAFGIRWGDAVIT